MASLVGSGSHSWRSVSKQDRVGFGALSARGCRLVRELRRSHVGAWRGKVALERECLIPVRLDRCDPPIEFRELQDADLTSWNGNSGDSAITDLLKAIESRLAKLQQSRDPSMSREDEELMTMLEELEQVRLEAGDPTILESKIRELKADMSAVPAPQPGDELDGRYQLKSPLGAGGFSAVWKAWDRELNRYLALKILHGQHTTNSDRVYRFQSGAKKQAKIQHDHVVRVINPALKDEQSGWYFFSMELIDGSNLRAAVLDGRLAREELFEVFRSIAGALGYSQSRHGLIHRDIKPGNILIGSRGKAWLTDFDLVLAAESFHVTTPGQVMGSYDFAAPEVLRGEGNASHASDVYSLAMTALWCLSGGKARREQAPDYAVAFESSELSLGAQEAILRGLDPDPSARPSSASELVEGLLIPASPGEALLSPRRTERPKPSETAEQRHANSRAAVAEGRSGTSLMFWGAGALALILLVTLGTSLWQGETRGATKEFEGRCPENWIPLGDDLIDGWASRATDPKSGLTFVLIPSGSFEMGAPETEPNSRPDERPMRRLEVKRPFYMAETEVSEKSWSRFGSDWPWTEESADLPKVGVSWYGAIQY